MCNDIQKEVEAAFAEMFEGTSTMAARKPRKEICEPDEEARIAELEDEANSQFGVGA
jgi:hypothetical protein